MIYLDAPWKDYRLHKDVPITLFCSADELEFIQEEPQDCKRICGMCKHYCPEVIGAAGNFCRRTGASEIGFFARKNCFEERMNDGKDK